MFIPQFLPAVPGPVRRRGSGGRRVFHASQKLAALVIRLTDNRRDVLEIEVLSVLVIDLVKFFHVCSESN